jgi:hypothetical protein
MPRAYRAGVLKVTSVFIAIVSVMGEQQELTQQQERCPQFLVNNKE